MIVNRLKLNRSLLICSYATIGVSENSRLNSVRSPEVLHGISISDWTQPTYWEAVSSVINSLGNHNKEFNWGYPVGFKQSADYNLCPTLPLPDGADRYECDAATCMLICDPGQSL